MGGEYGELVIAEFADTQNGYTEAMTFMYSLSNVLTKMYGRIDVVKVRLCAINRIAVFIPIGYDSARNVCVAYSCGWEHHAKYSGQTNNWLRGAQ